MLLNLGASRAAGAGLASSSTPTNEDMQPMTSSSGMASMALRTERP